MRRFFEFLARSLPGLHAPRSALAALLLCACCACATVPLAAQQCPDGSPPPCARTAARPPSVAILFMEPRSRNAADSLLAEGLTIEIINTLSGVTRLDVRSRWVSRRIAADADPMRSARALGVDYLVDGVLELDSARVLVRGALTRTTTGRVVRPLRIERRRAELEGLQVAVAQEVAAAVVGRLLPAERARFAVRRVDPQVTELVLTARALAHQYTAAAGGQAVARLRQAIAIDSTYAPAWAFLAGGYVVLRDFEPPDSTAGFYARAMAAGERAYALDSSSGLAMSFLASMRACFNDLSPRTEALARRAAAQEQGVETGLGLAWVLLGRGKVDEALSVGWEAARRDPLSPIAWSYAALRFSQARRFAEAAGARERVLALRPSAGDSLALQSARRWARLETRDCAGALADGRSAGDAMLTIESLRCLGRTAEADSIVRSRLAIPGLSPGDRAIYLAWSDQPDSAFAVLDRAFPPLLVLTILHPAFDPYRLHPAYLALRRRMGLEQ